LLLPGSEFCGLLALCSVILTLARQGHVPVRYTEGPFRLVKRRDPAVSLRHLALKIHRHQARKMTVSMTISGPFSCQGKQDGCVTEVMTRCGHITRDGRLAHIQMSSSLEWDNESFVECWGNNMLHTTDGDACASMQ